MTTALDEKLKQLPTSPGVYFYKDAAEEIIYIGKAANLRNRVRQYFQKSRARDPKTDALVAEIVDTEWQVVESEIDALFLEAELVRRYLPRYNILLRDDKSMVYVRINIDDAFPTVSLTRRPLDDGARYLGPYLSAYSIRQALKALRRAFPYATKQTLGQKRASLHYHLGLDPGLEEGKTSLKTYRANLRKLITVLEGKRRNVEYDLQKEMKKASNREDFETAARLRNQVFALQNLSNKVIFSDKEFLELSKDHALGELVELLGLSTFPKRMECYDISHQQGTDVVASMVVFTNGVSDKSQYRKFKTTRNRNDDFANMNEILSRRLAERNRNKWPDPQLIVIDGGKGQLDAALAARDAAGCQQIPFIGLAKREEQIVIRNGASNVSVHQQALHKLGGFATESEDFTLVNLPHSTNLIKLLQRIRDESHRFAVSYHSTLKAKRQTASILDDIPGIGPATRKKLIKTFGSVRALNQLSEAELAAVVGGRRAQSIAKYLGD